MMNKFMRRISIVLCIMLLTCTLGFGVSASSEKSKDSQISVSRVVSCSNCGGELAIKYVNEKTSTVIGTCDEDPGIKHYRAYRYRVLQCYDCGSIEAKVLIATGHYCKCDCKDSGCWCWD